jgi:hypothetical protein
MNRLKEIILQKEKANTGKKSKAKPQRVSQSDPSDASPEATTSTKSRRNEEDFSTAPDPESGEIADDVSSSMRPPEVAPTELKDESPASKDSSMKPSEALESANNSPAPAPDATPAIPGGDVPTTPDPAPVPTPAPDVAISVPDTNATSTTSTTETGASPTAPSSTSAASVPPSCGRLTSTLKFEWEAAWVAEQRRRGDYEKKLQSNEAWWPAALVWLKTQVHDFKFSQSYVVLFCSTSLLHWFLV